MIQWTDTSDGRVDERVGLAKIFHSLFFFCSLKEYLWETILLSQYDNKNNVKYVSTTGCYYHIICRLIK